MHSSLFYSLRRSSFRNYRGRRMSVERNYSFPSKKLLQGIHDTPKDSKTCPIILVACGSFSPVTYLHLRMFEMARDYLESKSIRVLAGFLSPTNNSYNKPGLAHSTHRIEMCRLATESSRWISVDDWECRQPRWMRMREVVQNFQTEVETIMKDHNQQFQIMLLAGGDLIEAFCKPGLFSDDDLDYMLKNHGCVVIERSGSTHDKLMATHDILSRHKHNIHVVRQDVFNDISSTKIRQFVQAQKSIKYLTPDPVVDYIYQHKLYTS
ncbi:hypothetical protein BKA69DRAFT_1108330 [Paraphysoderma sedebokerense]|nr:hypothetical protein BKA69DRAFT_1108330 [Paraphysoderma sedebokerense]